MASWFVSPIVIPLFLAIPIIGYALYRYRAYMLQMRGPTPTPHSVFSLQKSDFNDFLFAPVGEEENGMVLTALSALARSGVDPWDEAARLSELPRETATKSLTSLISELPNGRWAQSATGTIAARLIALLPVKRASVTQVRETSHDKHPVSARMVMCLFIVFFNVLVFSVIRNHEPQPAVGQSSSASSTSDSPQVPLADSK
jgi:hypothetical protein